MEILPSYIRDSKHFLHLLESLPPLCDNAILVNADVTSLYTNIPHEEDIESVLRYMKLHADTLPPGVSSPHTIGILLETILKNNNPSFMDKHFLQLFGTAMRTKAARPYVKLFMGGHENNHTRTLYLGNPLLEKVHRPHLPDLLKHYQPASIPTRLHEPLPPQNQVHLSTLHPTNILPRHEIHI